MRIEKRTMNWLPKLSTFEHARQQAAHRRAMAKSFISKQQDTAAMLSSANAVSSSGTVDLAIDQAVRRILSKKA